MRDGKKVKMGFSVLMLVGCILSGIGCIYLLVGLGLGLSSLPEATLFLWVFGGIGAGLLLAGMILLLLFLRKRAATQQAYESGEQLNCVITSIMTDSSIRVNHQRGVRVMCEWLDPASGTIHAFRSRYLRYCPDDIVGKTVPVYLDRYTGVSYMDIDAVLPPVVLH